MDAATLTSEIHMLAERAVRLARNEFHVELDYSCDSIRELEKLLDNFWRSTHPRWLLRLVGRDVPDDKIWRMSFLWGAYLGTVMEQSFGGQWTVEDLFGQQGVVTLNIGRAQTFPINKVYKRLKNGPDDDVWSYFDIERRLACGELQPPGQEKR